MFSRRRLFGTLTAVALLLTISAATLRAASGAATMHPSATVPTPAILAVPRLLPPEREVYTPYAAGGPITASDGRSIAQLTPGAAQPLSTFFPVLQAPISRIAYTILGSIQYTVRGHIVFVTTARPSVDAAQHQLGLGNQAAQLTNGATAWVSTGIASGPPSQVVYMKGDLIITVAGDLPVDDLKALAAQVVVK